MTHRRLMAQRQLACLLMLLLCLMTAGSAHADVFGRLRVTVQSANQPVQGASVTFHDTAGVNPDVSVTTGPDGTALSRPLEIRPWRITTQISTFNTDIRTVNVAADTTTEVAVALTKLISTGTSRITIITGNKTTTSTERPLQFTQTIPATGANPQNFQRLLLTSPGFVESSVNVAHPRGEHASTTIYIDGFQLPGALQGRAGPVISPDIIQNADIQTGGFAPEYGSETAAILNLSLRAGPIKPFQTISIGAGGYTTLDQELTFGGQAGADPGEPGPVRYLFNFINRTTGNAVEAPQPGDQSAHNNGKALTAFGNIDYQAGRNDQFSLLLNTAPAQTQVANRTGLPDKYAPVGQGFGYGGARNADGNEAGATPDPTVLGSQTLPISSQQNDNQDVYQNDENKFGALNYRHNFGNSLNGLLSLGTSSSRLDIRNNNPSINLNSIDPTTGYLTTLDNSIEFNPTIQRKSAQTELAGSLNKTAGTHTFKAGLLLTRQSGDELYNIIPQSQLALDAEAAIQGTGPALAPAGADQVDANGSPVLDVLGNPVYVITPGATAPTVLVHRSGYYNAGYLQDTWQATKKVTLNYGIRYDSYYGKQSLSPDNVKKDYLSPRLNFAYAFTPATSVRLSYDKLFSQPPLAQGAILGTNLVPQTTDLYEVDALHNLSRQQSLKMSYYYKNARNEFDTGLLIPYTQFGAYTTLQYTSQGVHGFELSYNFVPRTVVGLDGYLAYTNSIAKPNGLDQTGAPAPIVNDHDQLNTLSAGVSYTFASQAFAGLDAYYGSGEASSVLAPISASNTNVVNNGSRNSHYFINLRAGQPHLFGPAGLELDIENLTNDVSVLNFNSGYSGTRFQQGRQAIIRVTGSF
jgi:outer membrane receptor protein involved in Fe transport